MCFSVQVDTDIKKLAKRFQAEISEKDFQNLRDLQSYEKTANSEKLKLQMGLPRKPRSSLFKEADANHRIYPNGFAPVIIWEKGQRVLRPMRYRVRPHESKEEIPSQYNVFNARLDSLEKRRTWKSLFMKNHAIFPFVRFYEWVEDKNGKKYLICFHPQERELMWAPALYDSWTSQDGEIHFDSFALITDDPPAEVTAQGHDRCPIFIKEDCIDGWLKPQVQSVSHIYQMLRTIEPVYFQHSLAD